MSNHEKPSQHESIKMAQWTAGNTEAFTSEQLRPYGVLLVTILGTLFGDVPVQGSTRTEKKYKLICKGLPDDHNVIVVGAVCNRRFLAKVLGGTTTREWPGKQVWIYHDPTCEHVGETVGGIRFAWGEQYSGQMEKRRKSQPKPPQPPKPTPVTNGTKARASQTEPLPPQPAPPEASDEDEPIDESEPPLDVNPAG